MSICFVYIMIFIYTMAMVFQAQNLQNRGKRVQFSCLLLMAYMKKSIIGGIVAIIGMLSIGFGQMIVPDSENYILNENDQQVVDTKGIQDPLRDGAYIITQSETWELLGIVSSDDKITSHQNAQTKTMDIVKKIINYALWMIAFIALVYLIYHGFLIVTASGDDTQYKKGLSGVKFAAIAMAGVGASWFIVSAIFWLIALLIGK